MLWCVARERRRRTAGRRVGERVDETRSGAGTVRRASTVLVSLGLPAVSREIDFSPAAVGYNRRVVASDFSSASTFPGTHRATKLPEVFAHRHLLLLLNAIGLAVLASACASPTEIVLVIDTDLAVPIDIDHVDILARGAQMQSTVGVDVGTAGSPSFPLTLGLTPTGSGGPLSVTVVGSFQGRAVVQQDAATAFVNGSERMLRMLLLSSCIGTSCPTEQTCGSSGCIATSIAGPALPSWSGSSPARPVPATTTPIGGRGVWSNGWHSCANEGTILYCWGQNSYGEIGDGTKTDASTRRPILAVPNPAAVGLGQFISCVCDQTGQAWCWGRNGEAELGLGSTSEFMPNPTRLPGITDCLQITGGAQHTCVVRMNGTVSCWGANGSGQAGQDIASMPTVSSPLPVAGLVDVAEIQAGEKYTCARKNDMTVQCWGDNSRGQLGDGTNTIRSTPGPVSNLGADILEITGGRFFVCARHASGLVSCWGGGGSGQLGNGGTGDSPQVIDNPAVSDAIQLAAGFQHICALRRSGIVSCWGGNADGQLGDGTTTSSLSPVDVLDLAQVTSIAAGSVHTCARHGQGVSCWGQNVVNQIGDGTATDRPRPVSVAGFQ